MLVVVLLQSEVCLILQGLQDEVVQQGEIAVEVREDEPDLLVGVGLLLEEVLAKELGDGLLLNS